MLGVGTGTWRRAQTAGPPSGSRGASGAGRCGEARRPAERGGEQTMGRAAGKPCDGGGERRQRRDGPRGREEEVAAEDDDRRGG